MRLTSKSVDSEGSRSLSITWVGLIHHQVKAWSPKEEGILPPASFRVKQNISSSLGLLPAGSLCRFQTCSPHKSPAVMGLTSYVEESIRHEQRSQYFVCPMG